MLRGGASDVISIRFAGHMACGCALRGETMYENECVAGESDRPKTVRKASLWKLPWAMVISGACGLAMATPPPDQEIGRPAEAKAEKRQRTDIDKPSGMTGVVAGPASDSASKECVAKEGEVVCARRRLVFQRCAYGQTWKANACTGKAQVLTRKDIFNPQTKASLGQWRVPSVDEMGGAMGFFVKSSESPFQHGVKYWTSTRAAKDKGYTLIQYASKKTILGNGKLGTQLTNSEDEPQAQLILVRSGG